MRRTDAAGITTVAGRLTVHAHDEEGLQGIAADPNFATNRYVHLHHAPQLSTPDGAAPADGTDFTAWNSVNRLPRFTSTPTARSVHLGDYGPDAGAANASRGPAGQVEFNRITGPGCSGWPHCTRWPSRWVTRTGRAAARRWPR